MRSEESAARSLDSVLGELEAAIAQLADGAAPLDDLVSAHARASELLHEAETRFEQLKAEADGAARSLGA